MCNKITTINHNILQWTSLLTKWHTKIPAKYFGICSVSGACAISRATYKYTVGQTLPTGQSLTPMARMDHGGGGGGDSSPIALYLYLVWIMSLLQPIRKETAAGFLNGWVVGEGGRRLQWRCHSDKVVVCWLSYCHPLFFFSLSTWARC